MRHETGRQGYRGTGGTPVRVSDRYPSRNRNALTRHYIILVESRYARESNTGVPRYPGTPLVSLTSSGLSSEATR